MFEKYDNVDTMFDEIKSKIIKEVESAQKSTVEQLTEENKKLKNINKKLLEAAKRADREQDNFELFSYLVHRFKQKIQYMDNPERDRAVYEFLDVFFTKDFTENTYECPLWLGCVVQYYSNRDTVVKVLRMLDIEVPTNIDSFRLPHEWTTEELDIVFDTMSKHIVCNSCTYADNLRFWQPYALDDVYDVCYNCMSYSEIPWQFLLRNPNLLNKKYLKKIGKMAYEEPYVSGWRYLFAIDKYQDLTDEQLKTIIKEIDGAEANISKENSVSEFLLRHLDLIEDSILIDKIYKKYWDSYSFRYENRILKMPTEYLELWVKEKAHEDPREALEWIIRNKNNFSEEQKNNLLKLVMSEVLK